MFEINDLPSHQVVLSRTASIKHRDEKPCNVSLIDSLVLLLLFVHLFSFVESRRKKCYCISVLDQWIQTLG